MMATEADYICWGGALQRQGKGTHYYSVVQLEQSKLRKWLESLAGGIVP